VRYVVNPSYAGGTDARTAGHMVAASWCAGRAGTLRLMNSIYEQIGGREAVAAAVDVFYARVSRDPALAHYFGNTETAFDLVVDHLVATLIELEVPTALIVAIGEKVRPLRPLVVAQRAAA
jgi:hypothetical protein